MTKQRLAYFSTGSTSASFTENEDGSISKRALILVEGNHKDNKGRGHSFDADYIVTVANNSTAKFEKGGHIPVLKDHVKTLDSEVGEVGSPFVAKVITEDDLPNARNRHLIGKMGLFCDNMVIRAEDIVSRVKQGLHKKLSPGVDLLNKCINEISLTPTPAIQGLSMFSRPPLTFDEAEQDHQEIEELREEVQELTDKLLTILQSIQMTPEESLEGMDKDGLKEKAFSDYVERLQSVLSVGEDEEEEYDMPEYSLFDNDDAEFAVPGFLKNYGQSVGRGLNMLTDAGGELFKNQSKNANGLNRFQSSGNKIKNYFTKVKKVDVTQSPLPGTNLAPNNLPVKKKLVRELDTNKLLKAGGTAVGAAGIGAAGLYGASKLNPFKKEEPKKRFSLFG